ncbi:transporter substrate-binding domain-containing protein [Falseniella ignava]|uniref:Solute-binding protein family 3/N-terminal domain-containing protein n=1 Tax=Falseniella ignava CCUG 37419 TaxID=883112 RepID=K1M0D0_9LACT|nr:transporter substrate-binding domain-containing protein [Falseniella ignava]EKB55753.1 hypothetical protein HMPREF9707_00940 [Falseniella ignava CCUG 37419]
MKKTLKIFMSFILSALMINPLGIFAVTNVNIATTGDNKPYTYVDEDDQLTGYDIELARLIFEKLEDYDINFEITTFDSLFTGLSSGVYQMGASMLSYNDERSENYYYSRPINESPYYFVYRKGDEKLDNLTQFAEKGMVFYGLPGISASIMMENWNASQDDDKKIEIYYIDGSGGQTFLGALDNGIIDFTVFEAQLLNNFRASNEKVDEKVDYTLIDDKVLEGLPQEKIDEFVGNAQTYFVFPKTEEGKKLRDAVDEILLEFYKDGTLEKLQEDILKENQLPKPENMEKQTN